jgi:hypothetical protein
MKVISFLLVLISIIKIDASYAKTYTAPKLKIIVDFGEEVIIDGAKTSIDLTGRNFIGDSCGRGAFKEANAESIKKLKDGKIEVVYPEISVKKNSLGCFYTDYYRTTVHYRVSKGAKPSSVTFDARYEAERCEGKLVVDFRNSAEENTATITPHVSCN